MCSQDKHLYCSAPEVYGRFPDTSTPNAMATTDKHLTQDIPEPLLCPITLKLMLDPVLASDGHTYERAALQSWLDKGHDSSPITGAEINSSVTPNHTIKQMIHAFLAEHPYLQSVQFSAQDPEFTAMLTASAAAKPSMGPLKQHTPHPGGSGSNPFAAAPTTAPATASASPPSPPSSSRGNPFGNPFASASSSSPSPAPAAVAAAAASGSRIAPPGRTFVSAQQLLEASFRRVVPCAAGGTSNGRAVAEAARERLGSAAPRTMQAANAVPGAIKDLTSSMFKSAREGAMQALYGTMVQQEDPVLLAGAADALLSNQGLPALFHVLLQPALYPKNSVGQAAGCLQAALLPLPRPLHWWTCLGMALARRGKSKLQHLSGSTPPDVLQSAAAAFSSGASGLVSSRALQRRRSGSTNSSNIAPESAVASRHIGPAANVHDLWSFSVVYTAQGLVLREDFDTAAAAEAAAAAAAADGVPSKHTLGMTGEQSTDGRLQVITDRSGKEWVLPPCPEDVLVAALYACALADEPPVHADAGKAIKAMTEAGGEKRRSLDDAGFYGEDRPTGVKAWFSWKAPPPSGYEQAQANESVDGHCVEPLLRCLHTVLSQHPTMRPLPRAAARRWCGVLSAIMMSGRRGHTVRAWAAACIAVMAKQCDVAAACAFGWEVPVPQCTATGGGGAAAGPDQGPPGGALTNDPLQRFTALQLILAVAAKVRSPGAQACAAAAAESVLTTLLRNFNQDPGFVAFNLPRTQGVSSVLHSTQDKTAPVAAAVAALAPAQGVDSCGASSPGSPLSAPSEGGGSPAEAPLIQSAAWLNLLLAFHPRLPQTLCDLLLYGDSSTRLHASACATCLCLTGPSAISALQQVGLVEALASSIKSDEPATKRSVLQTLLVALDSSRYSWPPAAAAAAGDGASGQGGDSGAADGDAGVLTLTGGWDPAVRASFVRPPPNAPILRAPTPWEACAGDISRLGCVYVLADIARSKGTRRIMGMQEQMHRAVASGKLEGAGVGQLQFPLGAQVMDALAGCGDIGRDTALRARWGV